MKQIRHQLLSVFQMIPIYGFGSAIELNRVFTSYLMILVELRQAQPDNATIKGLIWNAHRIRRSVRNANESEQPVVAQECFNNASNELSLDMEYLISVLGIAMKTHDYK